MYHLFYLCLYIYKRAGNKFSEIAEIAPLVAYFILPVIFIIVLFYYNPIMDSYLWLLVLDRLLVSIVLLLLFALAFPLEIYWDLRIRMAKEKMRSLQHCYVIAVVGEYEKKETIHMIGQVFAEEQGIVTLAPKTMNKRSLAEAINSSVTDTTRMIIVGFNVFSKNDLYELSQLLTPNVVICTSVSGDKMPFYESFFRSLPETVPVLMNVSGDQNVHLLKHMTAKYRKKQRRIISYAVDGKTLTRGTSDGIVAGTITQKKGSTSFSVTLNGKSQHFTTPLLGTYSIMCLLPGVYLGATSGIPLQDLKKIVANLQSPEGIMVPYLLQHNTVLIDNSGSNSVAGVSSALSYMQVYKGKKILVYSPVSSLTDRASEEQSAIAAMIAQHCDHLFVVNKFFRRAIMKGFSGTNSKCAISYRNKYAIAGYLRKELQHKDTIVLFNGTDTQRVQRYVLKRVH